MSYKSLHYELLMKKEKFEVRKYPSFKLVQFESYGDSDSTTAFQALFNYIQGQNDDGKKIAMTTPVFQEKDSAAFRMSFVIPRSIEKPPQPKDPQLTLVQKNGGVYIVHRYRGAQSFENLEKYKKVLENILLERKYVSKGIILGAFYNSPFAFPFLKHNEVLTEIEGESFQPVY